MFYLFKNLHRLIMVLPELLARQKKNTPREASCAIPATDHTAAHGARLAMWLATFNRGAWQHLRMTESKLKQ